MDETKIAQFEEWLQGEFQSSSVITRTQQALSSQFGLEGDLAEGFQRRAAEHEDLFYSVQQEAYTLAGRPEISFIKRPGA